MTTQHISLSTAVTRTRAYYPTQARLNNTLRVAALLAGPAILVCLIPLVLYLTHDYSSLIMSRYLAGDPTWLTLYRLQPFLWMLVVADGLALVVYMVLVGGSDWLRMPVTPDYHYLAGAVAFLGAPHLLVVALAASAALLVVVFYAVIGVLAIIGLIVWLASMGARSNR